MYHYGGNNPIKYTDPTGEAVETIWDIGLTIHDIFSAISKSIKGDHSGWGDVALDAASILIPGVPAGLSKVDDVVKFSKNSVYTWWDDFISEFEKLGLLTQTKLTNNAKQKEPSYDGSFFNPQRFPDHPMHPADHPHPRR